MGFSLAAVKVDQKGRVTIPKDIREKAGIREGGYVKVKLEKGVVLEPIQAVADKHFGAFSVKKWPEDLDGFVAEVVAKWWTKAGKST